MWCSKQSIEFKRIVISEIKKCPEIWDKKIKKNNTKEWLKIQEKLSYSARELRQMWASFCSVYYRTLLQKTIERDFDVPGWKLFHDMSFMYEQVKQQIQSKLGGISPPLLIPSLSSSDLNREQCPCCMSFDTDPDPGTKTTSDKKTISIVPKLTPSSEVDDGEEEIQETVHTQCSPENNTSTTFGQGIEDAPNGKSSPSKNDALIELGPIEISDEEQTENVENNKRRKSPSKASEPPPKRLRKLKPKNRVVDMDADSSSSSNIEQTASIEPKPKTVEENRVTFRKYFKKPQRQTHKETLYLERTKIIDSVYKHIESHSLYNASLSNLASRWKLIAAEVGLPVSIVKIKWKNCKETYLKEMVKERYSNGTYISSWESYEHMSFMREKMHPEIEQIDRTRKAIQEILNQKKINEANIQNTSSKNHHEEVSNVAGNIYRIQTDLEAPPANTIKSNQSEEHSSPANNLEDVDFRNQHNLSGKSKVNAQNVSLEINNARSLHNEEFPNIPAQHEKGLTEEEIITDTKDHNVICIDDASVSSYEEVIVYISEHEGDDVACTVGDNEKDTTIS